MERGSTQTMFPGLRDGLTPYQHLPTLADEQQSSVAQPVSKKWRDNEANNSFRRTAPRYEEQNRGANPPKEEFPTPPWRKN